MTTLKQAIEMKEKLESEIRALLEKFDEETGLTPHRISVTVVEFQEMGAPPVKAISNVIVTCEL